MVVYYLEIISMTEMFALQSKTTTLTEKRACCLYDGVDN